MTTHRRMLATVCCGLSIALMTMQQRNRAIGRAVLQGPHHHHAGRHLAGRHQRHLGAPGGAAFRPLHPGQSRTSWCRTTPAAAAWSPPTGIYHNVEKDGTVLAKLERAVPQLAIQGDPNAQFDPMKFIWLGSLSSYADDAYLLADQRRPSGQESIDEIRPARQVAQRSAPTAPLRAT